MRRDEQDRLVLEQYRPYITMMNARAKASSCSRTANTPTRIDAVDAGFDDDQGILRQLRQEQAYNPLERGSGC